MKKTKEKSVRNLNLILLGNSRAGKTCLIVRYTEDKYSSSFSSTLGIDFKLKMIPMKNYVVKLQVWDTGGQERFHTITKGYYGKAMGVILVYDSNDLKSYQDIKNWMMQIENHARKDIAKVLIAAKCDDDSHLVTKEMGQTMADEYGIPFYETSAKTGMNVTEAFECIVKEILDKKLDLSNEEIQAQNNEKKQKTIKLKKAKKKKEGCC